MFESAVVRCYAVAVYVCDLFDAGVTGGAVVALIINMSVRSLRLRLRECDMVELGTLTHLVIVLAHELPVVFSVCSPCSMINIVIKGKIFQTRLLICATVHLLPRYWRVRRIEVHPNEASSINMRMDLKQAIFILIELG